MESWAKILYENKLMSAPMVRGSTLPFRLACSDYGADTVFSPALTDVSLKNCSVVSDENGLISFLSDQHGSKVPILQTTASEKSRLVCQLVSVDGCNAVLGAHKLEGYCSGIDINCGCPEDFATHRGGGSAMTLERVVDVVTCLKRDTNFSVSVKMRVSDDIEKSIQFAQASVRSGADALIVHGRTVDQRKKGSINYESMKQIFDSVETIKVGNGGVTSLSSAKEMRHNTGCSGVMIGKSALCNPSVFSEDKVEVTDVIEKMTSYSRIFKLDLRESKWSIMQIIDGNNSLRRMIGQQASQCKTWEEFDQVFHNKA